MSKKYFINNLDTAFGQALIQQLVKQPTEDPVHMCTVRVPVDTKPQGIKKILKREKPKLFRKKMIDQCEVYIYNIDQTEISDIQFGIESMQKPFEDNKVFIFVSDIMAWSNSGRKIKKQAPPPPPEEGTQPPAQPKEVPPEQEKPEQPKSEGDESEEKQFEEKPIEYTFFEDSDYQSRIPLEKYKYIKQIEDKVLTIKRENVKVFIVCPGIIYGCGEDTFYELFKASWLQQPQHLPYLLEGNNKVPTIHLKDLVKFVIKVAESPPEGIPYLLAIDQTENKSQKTIVQAISSGIGSGKIQSVKSSVLIENPDRYLIDIDIKASKILIGTPQQPVEFEWTARKGIIQSVKSLLKDFCDKQKLRPMKLIINLNDKQWKTSKIQYILKTYSEYYRIPVLTIKNTLQSAKELGDQQLAQDLRQQWENIINYLEGGVPIKELNQTLKVFYRAIRWRLTQNDCTNRGYIISDFPTFTTELNVIFNKLSLKKLKRKKPKVVPKVSEKSIASEGDIGDVPPEQPKEQEPVEQQNAEEGQQAGPKQQPYFPQSLITIKKMGTQSNAEVVDFFALKGIDELVYDTTGMKEHDIFESLRHYIQRNNRPNNYLIAEEELLKKHKQFTLNENKESLAKRENQNKKQQQAKLDLEGKRKKLAEDIIEIVKNQGEQQIKKMPFRNYLMEFVVPTLNIGLLQVSNIIPNDPVDLLAEFLYQKSYDA